MAKRVLIIGGYGNFGRFIARRLAREPDIAVTIAGRSAESAKALAQALDVDWAVIDVQGHVDAEIARMKPDIVVHTSGPFQGQSYAVAETCIRNGCHYIDLADGRDFVTGITRLDDAATAAGVTAVSGASSVPALTSAIVDDNIGAFEVLQTIDSGISTAQRTMRGRATARAVLSYAGISFTTLRRGKMDRVHGWQGLRWRKFPGLGWRPLANCDVPDLALFPQRYPTLETMRFQAGFELSILQISLWALSWLVRVGALPRLDVIAAPLLALARPLDLFGSDRSGFFLEMTGLDKDGRRQRIGFDLVAGSGDGLMIPCLPAVVLALDLASGRLVRRGAMSCMGLVGIESLLNEMKPFDIRWEVTRAAT